MIKWDVVYKSAYNDDGSLLFPKKLTEEFLKDAKRTMGSYEFANQYLNQPIPDELRVFKKEWFRYYGLAPNPKTTFMTVDPAIGLEDNHDYTGIVIVHTDLEGNWYVDHASHQKLSTTALIDRIFQLHKEFKPQVIGIETVAFQKALVYVLHQESKRRQTVLPIAEIKHGPELTKVMRIQGLQPRFEFGRIFLKGEIKDLENELLDFPRGSHDDIIDALAMVDQIASYPVQQRRMNAEPAKNSPDYERWYIANVLKRGNRES